VNSVACLVSESRKDTATKAAVEAPKPFKMLSVTTELNPRSTPRSRPTWALRFTTVIPTAPEKGAAENNIGLHHDYFPNKQALPDCPYRTSQACRMIQNRPNKGGYFITPDSFFARIHDSWNRMTDIIVQPSIHIKFSLLWHGTSCRLILHRTITIDIVLITTQT
jgi:hypothetical protein